MLRASVYHCFGYP